MYITSCEGGDGFGAQYQRIISSIMYAELSNNEFVYRPFKEMEHNYDSDQNFIQNKENFINLINNYKNINEVNNVVSLGPRIYEVENNLDSCLQLESLKKIKRLIHENKKKPYDDNFLNISVHIRRFNTHDNGDYAYVEDDYFLNVINHIRNTYEGNKLFHIYSQGNEKLFERYLSNDVIFHLDETIESTFYGLITSDILVMSKSSLSYSAGILSDGIVYYLPFWHKPATKWLTLLK
jgi:hypothetical protein